MKITEEPPAHKEVEVVPERELTHKKAETFLLKDIENGLGLTKKKRKKNEKDEKDAQKSFMETPKIDRASFSKFESSPIKDKFDGLDSE